MAAPHADRPYVKPVGTTARKSDRVRLLGPEQRALLAPHLVRLTAEDRRLRFGARMNDALIERYLAAIDFSNDQMFGVLAPSGSLIGLAHLALDRSRGFAEIGLSVDPAYRNQGLGCALLKRAIQHAASAGYRTLFMHCLSENGIITRLARRVGLIVVTAHGEADGQMELTREVHGGEIARTVPPAVLMDSQLCKSLAPIVEAGRSITAAASTQVHAPPVNQPA